MKDIGQSIFPEPGTDYLRVPTSQGVYLVKIVHPYPDGDRGQPWLSRIEVEDPEVEAEWEVVTVPLPLLLRKGGPRPDPPADQPIIRT